MSIAAEERLSFVQEFADARDADDARHYCNGKDFDGNRLIVEFARRVSVITATAESALWDRLIDLVLRLVAIIVC